MRLATHAVCWYGDCSYGYCFTGKYVLFCCSLCHQTLQHIIPTTDGGACRVLRPSKVTWAVTVLVSMGASITLPR